jgi:nucleoside-diphosphate-sugar epimerase
VAVLKDKVFVTGAGGFLGGWFVEALHLQGRHRVLAGLNSWASAARIARFPIDFVQANLLDMPSIDRALEGVDAVIHCAFSENNALSVQATRNLFEAVRKQGIRRLIHISSIAVYGNASGHVDEETTPIGTITNYGFGKQQTESVAQEFAGPDLAVSVIRPTVIYGPFSTSWTLPAINRIRSGKWRHLGSRGEGKANLVYAGDVVKLAEFLLDREVEPFSVYNCNGPEIPTWNEYYERMSEAMGFGLSQPEHGSVALKVLVRRPVRVAGKYVLKYHRDLLTGMAARSHLFIDTLRKVEEDLRLRLNDSEMALFGNGTTYSIDKIKQLGFTPRTGLDRGISYSVEWAKAVGLI